MSIFQKSFLFALAIYLSSAVIGALIAYRPTTAWIRFGLIALGVGICLVLARTSERSPRLRILFALLPIAVLMYFVLTNDWTGRIGKLTWLDPLLSWLASWQPSIAAARLDSNVLGGVLASLLPLQIAVVFLARTQNRNRLGLVLVGLTLIGLVLSESRGAWVAIAITVALGALWLLSDRLARRWSGNKKRRIQIAISVGVLLVVSLIGVVGALTPFGQDLLNRRSDRLTVWRNSLDLAGDYAFTGLGLASFDMAYSSYVLLLHVSHTTHAHNLFLDVWLEQGLLGLVALASIVAIPTIAAINSFLRGEPVSRWQVAAFASLGVVLLHGMVDDSFYGYGGIAIPFVFVPLGLVARRAELHGTPSRNRYLRTVAILGVVASTCVAIIAMQPGVRSAFVANMGAASQTRAELSVYNWPTWSIQDELRRSPTIDLSLAIEMYESALAIDPQNATANRRLGQIELSRGEYSAAQAHLQAAFAINSSQRATRQMLGELNAIAGNVDQAIVLWKKTDVSDGQLAIRQWWYAHIGEQKYANWVKEAASCCDN